MKKACAEFNIEGKRCGMTLDDNKVNCHAFSIGSYMYNDADGKKQVCNYTSFAMKDEEGADCNYHIMHDTCDDQVTISKNSCKTLATIKESMELDKIIAKTSIIFDKSKSTKITMDQLILDVFNVYDQQDRVIKTSDVK